MRLAAQRRVPTVKRSIGAMPDVTPDRDICSAHGGANAIVPGFVVGPDREKFRHEHQRPRFGYLEPENGSAP